MANNAWIEAKVASLITRLPNEPNGIPLIEMITDVSKSVEKHKSSSNLDRRLVAIGSEDDRHFFHQIMSDPGSEFYDILHYAFNRVVELLLLSGKTPSVLLNNPTIHMPIISSYREFMGVENIAFVNNADLVIYEQSVRNFVDGAIDSYDVYDTADLGLTLDEKFDLIGIHGIEAASNIDLMSTLVDSLKPGGRLFINGTGKGRNYFNSTYFAHQFFHLHKFLHSQEGSTFHIVDVGGVTIFIKH